MKRIRELHSAMAFMNLAAGFGGLAFRESAPIDLNVILMVVLLLMIRAKFWLDDDAYFEDVQKKRLPAGIPFAIGLFLGFISWILWNFAGFYIKDLELTSLLMIFTYAVSTMWIVAAMVTSGAYAEQKPWLFFNVLYGVGFYLIYARTHDWNPFRNTFNGYTTAV